MQCMSVVAGLVRDAIAAEDLVLPKDFTPEKLVFGLWSLTTGAFAIIFTSDSFATDGGSSSHSKPFETTRRQSLMDTAGARFQMSSTPTKFLKDSQRSIFGMNEISTPAKRENIDETSHRMGRWNSVDRWSFCFPFEWTFGAEGCKFFT